MDQWWQACLELTLTSFWLHHHSQVLAPSQSPVLMRLLSMRRQLSSVTAPLPAGVMRDSSRDNDHTVFSSPHVTESHEMCFIMNFRQDVISKTALAAPPPPCEFPTKKVFPFEYASSVFNKYNHRIMTEDIFYRSILVRCVRLVWTSRRDYFPMQKTTLLRGKHMLWEEKEQSHGWWGLERARLILFCFVFFLFAGKFFVSETPLRDSHTFVSLSAKSSFTESFFFFFLHTVTRMLRYFWRMQFIFVHQLALLSCRFNV